MESRLHAKTFKLINKELDKSNNRHATLTEIAEKTGLSVPWLDYFARNPEKSASVERVEKLYNHLNTTKLRA